MMMATGLFKETSAPQVTIQGWVFKVYFHPPLPRAGKQFLPPLYKQNEAKG
jgi:hypothetical protein